MIARKRIANALTIAVVAMGIVVAAATSVQALAGVAPVRACPKRGTDGSAGVVGLARGASGLRDYRRSMPYPNSTRAGLIATTVYCSSGSAWDGSSSGVNPRPMLRYRAIAARLS
jgi:hypothetical protein